MQEGQKIINAPKITRFGETGAAEISLKAWEPNNPATLLTRAPEQHGLADHEGALANGWRRGRCEFGCGALARDVGW